MKHIKSNKTVIAAVLVCLSLLLFSCQKDNPEKPTSKINYHFATLSEGQQLLAANDEYYNSMSQNNIDWRMRRTGASLDELKAFAQTCVRDFSDEEKTAITRAVAFIEAKLNAMGASLPFPENDIVFVRTTMQEESNAGGYTHKTEIYVGERMLRYGIPREGDDEATTESRWLYFNYAIAHELFHCLTRNSPEFRSQMYSLIGFTTTANDFVFSTDIQNRILINPDVEHIDNYAEFTINGVKRNCELLVLFTKTWEEAYAEVGDEASFFKFNQAVLVPIDALDTYYPVEEVPDFWDIVGNNTDYVIAPEECLADNFGFTVVYGLDGKEYQTPELITSIYNALRNYRE
jgi:hypothetical protein